MKNIAIIILGSLFLISATVTTTLVTVKPQAPQTTTFLSGYIGYNDGSELALKAQLSVYMKVGYQVKSINTVGTGSYSYFIVLEKY